MSNPIRNLFFSHFYGGSCTVKQKQNKTENNSINTNAFKSIFFFAVSWQELFFLAPVIWTVCNQCRADILVLSARSAKAFLWTCATKGGWGFKGWRGWWWREGGRGASPHRVTQSRGFWANGLTLNVDIAGSLLYLSMVWNLDEWLSSWYSSECLLRVCITFWKGRKEGTTKNEPKKKGEAGTNYRGRQESGSGWKDEGAVMMPAVKRG